jgi:hypothetical protein
VGGGKCGKSIDISLFSFRTTSSARHLLADINVVISMLVHLWGKNTEITHENHNKRVNAINNDRLIVSLQRIQNIRLQLAAIKIQTYTAFRMIPMILRKSSSSCGHLQNPHRVAS